MWSTFNAIWPQPGQIWCGRLWTTTSRFPIWPGTKPQLSNSTTSHSNSGLRGFPLGARLALGNGSRAVLVNGIPVASVNGTSDGPRVSTPELLSNVRRERSLAHARQRIRARYREYRACRQQAGDLKRGDSSRRVPQPRRDSHAHTRGPERVWAVISGDQPAGSARVRIVIQPQERGREGPRQQEGSWLERRVHHTSTGKASPRPPAAVRARLRFRQWEDIVWPIEV